MIGAGGINDECFFPVISGVKKGQKERGVGMRVEQDMAFNLEGGGDILDTLLFLWLFLFNRTMLICGLALGPEKGTWLVVHGIARSLGVQTKSKKACECVCVCVLKIYGEVFFLTMYASCLIVVIIIHCPVRRKLFSSPGLPAPKVRSRSLAAHASLSWA